MLLLAEGKRSASRATDRRNNRADQRSQPVVLAAEYSAAACGTSRSNARPLRQFDTLKIEMRGNQSSGGLLSA